MLLATGCNGDEATPEASPPTEHQTAFQGLCRTFQLVNEGRLDEAERVYKDRAHGYLHEIAIKGLDAVPGPTAALLEAKRIVDESLNGPRPPDPALLQALFDIQQAFRDLSRELGQPVPRPCAGAAA
jgi:hypothetical protein